MPSKEKGKMPWEKGMMTNERDISLFWAKFKPVLNNAIGFGGTGVPRGNS